MAADCDDKGNEMAVRTLAGNVDDGKKVLSWQRQLHHSEEELSFVKAILSHTIPERQSKYLKLSPDTFVGTFSIVPHDMLSVTDSDSALRLHNVKEFEFFMWTNIDKQPTLDYIKKRIAQAVGVKTSDFAFETRYGVPLNYFEIAIETLARLSKPGCSFSTLAGKPLVEIIIVPKERREGPDDPRHPDIPYVLEPCDKKRATAFWAQADADRLVLEAYKKEKDENLNVY